MSCRGGCDTCDVMKRVRAMLKACESCDNGSHHGKSHVQATDYTLAQRKLDDHTPSPGVTNLSPEDEDKLRRAMSSLFGLDPVDLLMVQHLFAGRPLAAFGDTLVRVHKRIHHYKGGIRQMAHAKKDAIARIFPQISPVFKHQIDPNAPVDADPDDIGGLVDDGV